MALAMAMAMALAMALTLRLRVRNNLLLRRNNFFCSLSEIIFLAGREKNDSHCHECKK
jgi:hypothetical protein